MIHIAIVEDDKTSALRFRKYIMQYEQQTNTQLDLKIFPNGYDFLEYFEKEEVHIVFLDIMRQHDVHIVFLDIMLPLMDGFDIAKRIRQKDNITSIIFITNMAQYAVKGYEYEAIAYMVKPVTYVDLKMKLAKAINLQKGRNQVSVVLQGKDGLQRILYSDIMYLESDRHYITYHTTNGLIIARETISSIEEKFIPYKFFRIHKSYIVNLEYVKRITGTTCYVNEDALPISIKCKSEFLKTMAEYWGGDLV